MSWPITVAVLAVTLFNNSLAHADAPAGAKQLQVKVRLLEGDPRGSQAAGTLKLLADTRVTAVEHRPFSVVSGSEIAAPGDDGKPLIAPGRIVKGTATLMKDGRARLDVTLSNVTLAERADERVQLHTESARTIAVIRPGEVLKVRLGKGKAGRQVWAELSIEIGNP